MRKTYDLDSAITFLLVGLGIGSVLALLFNPEERLRMEGSKAVRGWRVRGLQGRERAEQPIA
jgi:hypothetical protein